MEALHRQPLREPGHKAQLIFVPAPGQTYNVKAKDGVTYVADGRGALRRPDRLRGKAAVKARKRQRQLERRQVGA